MSKNSTKSTLLEDNEKNLLNVIKQRKAFLNKIITEKEVALKNAPEGLLRITSRGTRIQYYLRTDPKDFNGEYIRHDNLQLAQKLAQKDYDTRLLKLAQKEIKLVERYEQLLDGNCIISIFDSMSQMRKMLIAPIVPSDEQYIEKWKEISYEPMPFDESIGALYTREGTRVRSKSELIIANMLEQYNIPYKYECPIVLQGFGTVRPDFTCLNVRTRTEYIWEHFGMMDNISYANKNIAKIQAYEKNGFYAGKNMIMTFEASQHAISSNIIKNSIEVYLC